MAIEIKTRDLDEIKRMAEELLEKAESTDDVKTKQSINADLDQVIGAYAAESKSRCYKAAEASGNPMHYAVTTFSFPCIKVREKNDKETGVIVRSIEPAQRPIDLVDMHKKIGIGADRKWYSALQKFNFYLTIRAAERVGAKVNSDAMLMDDIAREFDLGKNPCSNTQMLKTLQGIVDMMLGEGYKATSHDVNYLVDCYANDDKKSKTSITVANHKTLARYLKKVCGRILTNGTGYDVIQKEIKEDKNA